MLQEALAVGPDPLHLTVVFNLSFDTAMTYTQIASAILDTCSGLRAELLSAENDVSGSAQLTSVR